MGTRILGLISAVAIATAAPAFALGQDEPVPPKLALLVMLKVLTYDKNLAARGEGDFVVLVATEAGQEAARREALTATEELRGATLRTRAVRFRFVAFSSEATLRQAVIDHKAEAVLLLPGLTAAGLETAASVAGSLQLYTLSLDPSFVEQSLAVGVTNHAGRPQIVLNLAAARLANASFEPAVLKLARIIQ
ncbi:MAG: YfiR/HmsC family protein [Myxococcota bacterium]|nr:YfiR/HmsC family protein [Myxococcota bacterium]